ncbi:methyl-galactoside transport system substrate-binding protein [Clostridium amylolyticum]|uniref:D-galactose/methyl-galactoside binding periplasmic protein MglB n=1 Tax=Clostridium amylolyticum TaxID=1121298 RepID=A0A1M6JLD0_9CLOT|nr:galactose ABC transporter substrate-binding protein [Clostridium amylolyticum]SHJ47493.1 methyl-galactoside transport system substrate-binding protein [Clostridium amylolyticum]
MKKILAIMAAALITASALVGCGNKGDAGKTGADGKKALKVGVALYKFDDTFISTVRKAIEEEAKAVGSKDGVEISLNFTDGQGQQAAQNDQIDTFITQKYDVLAVNMVDRTAASVIIDKAKQAGIPVVFFNREPVKEDMAKWDKLFYVGAKAEESGTMQGQMAADYWKKHPEADKNKDGKIQYVMLEGEPGHQDAILRTQFSIKALDEAGIKTEKLAGDTANWQRAQGQEKMGAWLSSFGDKIEVVFANNDDMALGAIEALKAAGYYTGDKFIPVVGVDATAPALDSLKENKLYGTVLNDAKNQGKAILNTAYSLAKKEDPSKFVEGITDGKYKWVPYQPVTKENAEKMK